MGDEERDPHELTADEAFEIRKAATLLNAKLRESTLARALHDIADDHDAPDCCEGCTAPATRSDSEGVPLCDECMVNLFAVQVLKVGQVWKYTDQHDASAWTLDRITEIDGRRVTLVQEKATLGFPEDCIGTADVWDAKGLMDDRLWTLHQDVEPAEDPAR